VERREAIFDAAAWILLVLIILAILLFANLPCGGPQHISCRLLETLLKWTLRAFVFCLPLVIGFSLRRRTRPVETDEPGRGDWHWLP